MIEALTNVICDIRGDEKPYRWYKLCKMREIFKRQIIFIVFAYRFITSDRNSSDSEEQTVSEGQTDDTSSISNSTVKRNRVSSSKRK